MRDVNEDTNAHDIVMDQWQDVGNECHVIRSHRRPRDARRGPLTMVALAVVTSLGITAIAYNAAPEDEPTTVASGTFVEPTVDDLIARAELDNVPSRKSRSEIVQIPKPKPKPKAARSRWVSPTTVTKITSCFGMRNGRMHMGMDFDGEHGDKIRAVGGGKVVQAGWKYGGLGYSVVIDHGDGSMTLYGHASRVLVRTGQRVSAGDLVALMGSTGHSTGDHLHLGVAKTSRLGDLFNRLVNPAPWLVGHGLAAGRCA